MPTYPTNAIPFDPNVNYTANTNRDGRVVPVEMTIDNPRSNWRLALTDNRTTLIRIRVTVGLDEENEHVSSTEVLYARTPDEKVALLLDARGDDVMLFAWPGQHHQDIFAIGDVSEALQALGLRPAKIEPIRDASGREWLAGDTAPLSNAFRRQRALNARSRLIDFEVDDSVDDFS